MLNGDGVIKSTLYGVIPPELMWVLIGLEDFNADGSADMLWYHIESGLLVAALLDGNSIIQVSSYGLALPALDGWSMLGLNDFNGDGRADILWNNAYTGEVKSWLLSEDGVIGDVSYGSIAVNSGWSLLGADDYNGDGRSDLLWYNYFSNATEAWLVSNNGAKRVSYEDVPRSEAWLIQVPPR